MATRVVPAVAIAASPSTHTTHPTANVEYSLEKFKALQLYTETASRWRVVWVLVTTPLYGLAGALLPSFVPVQDPLDPRGVFANPGYIINTYLLCYVVFLGTFMHWRASTGLPDSVYSWRHVLIAAPVGAAVSALFALLVAVVWRFPIPMSWIVVSSVSLVSMAAAYLAAFRQRCWQDKELVDGVKKYLPALNLQTLQLVIYPAFSVLFDHVSTIYQVLLTLCFPLLKLLMKRSLHLLTRDLRDFSTEVAVSGVEICAALYQSMIMQNAPSQVAMGIIMGVDVVQGLVMVKFFMDRRCGTTPQHLVVREAFRELQQKEPFVTTNEAATVSPPDDQVHALRLASTESLADLQHSAFSPARVQSEPPVTNIVSAREGPPEMSKSTPQVVRQALELVNVAESILLVEYLEVAIPLVNGLFVAISCQFSGAQYNTRLRNLYFHPEALSHALGSILVYSLLQAVSFVAMHLVMKHRYGLSAVYHLAFLLEYHQASLVGKTLAWLPMILHFTGVHYGVDFSFRFDFAAMLRDSQST